MSCDSTSDKADQLAKKLDEVKPTRESANEALKELSDYLNTLSFGDQLKMVYEINKRERDGVGADLTKLRDGSTEKYTLSFYDSSLYSTVGWSTEKEIARNSMSKPSAEPGIQFSTDLNNCPDFKKEHKWTSVSAS